MQKKKIGSAMVGHNQIKKIKIYFMKILILQNKINIGNSQYLDAK